MDMDTISIVLMNLKIKWICNSQIKEDTYFTVEMSK